MPWKEILPLAHVIWGAAAPALKQKALDELKKLEAKEAAQPLLVSLIQEAETLVAAA